VADREKVIEGLKCCKPAWFTVANCADEHCPYDCYGHNEVNGCVDHLIDDALELLKEQEAVEPIERNGFYYCGACRYALMTNHQKYCSDCGKKVKWE
jgi:hypothetical protein